MDKLARVFPKRMTMSNNAIVAIVITPVRMRTSIKPTASGILIGRNSYQTNTGS